MMEYREIRENIEEMSQENYRDFIKAIIGFEMGIIDETLLDEMFDKYMENDSMILLSDNFKEIFDDLLTKREANLMEEIIKKEDKGIGR